MLQKLLLPDTVYRVAVCEAPGVQLVAVACSNYKLYLVGIYTGLIAGRLEGLHQAPVYSVAFGDLWRRQRRNGGVVCGPVHADPPPARSFDRCA
eukprot:m.122840 g.122840  ORF g.122840 m.122840 type:complete len:94 (+) comp19679_c0_seq2:363-644(+)